ncbi:MAG: division/cell wall cluster transcriptional repressor MraZ [Nitrospinales bacterium]
MIGFLGTYYVNLDEKGRANIPSKFRRVLDRDLNPNVVVSRTHGHLSVFEPSVWEKFVGQCDDVSPFDRKESDRLRQFTSKADTCEIKSGKLLIPSQLRKVAGLNKEVALVGMSTYFEIWDMNRLEEHERQVEHDLQVERERQAEQEREPEQ